MRRRHQAIAACGALVLAASVLGAGAPPAQAGDTATDDTAITGSGVPVTVDVLANDQVAGDVASVEIGTVIGVDASTVDVGDDFRITFANNNPDYPNSSTARVFKTADFTVPYTVTDTDGATTSATLTVTVAGKPVSPMFSSWILNDPSTGVKAVTNLNQLYLKTYPQTTDINKSAIPGYGVTVTGLVDAEHATAVPVPGGIELQASPRDYIGNDVVTLELTDMWDRSVQHKAGVSWVERAAVAKLRTKVGVGQSAHVDLREIVAGTSFANFTNGYSRRRSTSGAVPSPPVRTHRTSSSRPARASSGPRTAPWYAVHLGLHPGEPVEVQRLPGSRHQCHVQHHVHRRPGTAGRRGRRGVDDRREGSGSRPVCPGHAALARLDLRASRRAPARHGHGDGRRPGRLHARRGFPAAEALAETDSFTYAWIDDLGQESEARATVTVRNLPTLADHALTTPAGVPVDVGLLEGAFGDGVTITGVGARPAARSR
ncbi:hypothetical protein NKG05_29415 [Oerskovia sp. M15]